MKPSFQEAKATQTATMLLSLSGGEMNYMKLIKEMYLIDREALLRWGRPVSYDSYFSLRHGPILSNTLDLINEGVRPLAESEWVDHISAPTNYSVSLKKECPPDDLSEAEEELIQEIFKQFRCMNEWQLVDYLHENLPEWKDPSGSAIPINYHDILVAGGKTVLAASEIESELEDLALMDGLLG